MVSVRAGEHGRRPQGRGGRGFCGVEDALCDRVWFLCVVSRRRSRPVGNSHSRRAFTTNNSSRTVCVGRNDGVFAGGLAAPREKGLQAVWKSTSASGVPDNSSLNHFWAMTRPSWLGRVARNRHRHAIEQVSRRWRGGRRDDSARTRRKI
jgi:hypothetical protein